MSMRTIAAVEVRNMDGDEASESTPSGWYDVVLLFSSLSSHPDHRRSLVSVGGPRVGAIERYGMVTWSL